MVCLVSVLLAVSADAAAAKKRIVTTFTIIQDMAQNVAGDAAIVESITKPGAEIHGYEPTPQDIVKAQRADLVLWNGLNLERWFERFGWPSLLFSWVPILGDPLTIVVGTLGYPLGRFTALVLIGKTLRYGALWAGWSAF